MIHKSDVPIRTLEDWRERAGPKRPMHWADGRSALECARAWLSAAPGIPAELQHVLDEHAAFSSLLWWRGEPEARVRFDSLGGESSNVDLLVEAEDRYGPLVIVVEAKADESFGASVAATMKAAVRRREDNPRSMGVQRVEQLAQAVLGVAPRDIVARCGAIRYQLLTATAAALRAAEKAGAARAVLLVHEFITDRTSDAKHRRNHADLDAFLILLKARLSGKLHGAVRVPGAPLFASETALYIGKASRQLRSAAS